MSQLINETVLLDPPKTVEEALRTVERVLNKPFVSYVGISKDGIQVKWRRDPKDSLQVDLLIEPEIKDVIHGIVIKEFNQETNSRETLLGAMIEMTKMSLEPTFLLCGNKQELFSWLGTFIPMLPQTGAAGRERMLGLELVETGELSSDTLLLCGSGNKNTELSLIQFGFRIVME